MADIGNKVGELSLGNLTETTVLNCEWELGLGLGLRVSAACSAVGVGRRQSVT